MGGGLGGTEVRKPQSIHVCVSNFPSSSPERLTSAEPLGVTHDNGALCPAAGLSAFEVPPPRGLSTRSPSPALRTRGDPRRARGQLRPGTSILSSSLLKLPLHLILPRINISYDTE